ncbi:MAG: COX15/CtaA family protein [Thermoanaerobaculia bacterium]
MKSRPAAPFRRQRRNSFNRFAWFVLALNLAVIVWGGFVRASGSGAGCGAHWPLCNGEVVPQDPEIETLIELGHRVTSGLALVAVVALGIRTRQRYSRDTPDGRGMRRLAWLAILFIFGEAALGAGLVLLEYVGQNGSGARAVWMAGHLVNTFLLVAILALLAERSRNGDGDEKLAAERDKTGATADLVPLWKDFLSFTALLLTAVTGAIAALGDTLFPATSLVAGLAQDLSPTAHFLIQLRVLHPLVAIGAGVLWIRLAQRTRDAAPAGARAGLWAKWLLIFVATQFAIGLATLAFLAPVPLQLLHLLGADLVWISGVLLVDSRRRATLAAAGA